MYSQITNGVRFILFDVNSFYTFILNACGLQETAYTHRLITQHEISHAVPECVAPTSMGFYKP